MVMEFSPVNYNAIVIPKPVLYLAITLGWVRDATDWLLCKVGLLEHVDYEAVSWQHHMEFHSPLSSASASRIREALPLLDFGEYVERHSEMEEDDISCTICLCSFKKKDAIRELCNCRHIFHSNCLDGWIQHAQTRCPLCRRSMLPESESVEAHNVRNDQVWVMEQMLYAFDADLAVSAF